MRKFVDGLCIPCETREKAEKKRADAELRALVEQQLSLPDGHSSRIFTDAEIRDVRATHCDKQGFNRVLLQALRKRLGMF